MWWGCRLQRFSGGELVGKNVCLVSPEHLTLLIVSEKHTQQSAGRQLRLCDRQRSQVNLTKEVIDSVRMRRPLEAHGQVGNSPEPAQGFGAARHDVNCWTDPATNR